MFRICSQWGLSDFYRLFEKYNIRVLGTQVKTLELGMVILLR